MTKYLVIIEPTETGFSAYSPDVPGCTATGETRDQVHNNFQEALEFHLEGLLLEGLEIPKPLSSADYALVS